LERYFGHYEFHKIKAIDEAEVELEGEIALDYFDSSNAGGTS
jgi:hypothetical protein